MDKKARIKKIEAEIKQLKKKLESIEGQVCEVYTRIVGYFRNVENWNHGKKEEYKDRKSVSWEKALDKKMNKK